MGGQELIQNIERWCLWVGDADPTELRKMPLVLERIENVRQVRLASASPPTQKIANVPTHFHVENFPEKDYLAIPKVSSERRDFIPIKLEDANTLSSDLLFVVPGATLYHFGVLTSTIHMAWVRTTCGRLKSDYRYSKDIVYNNFPWPGCGGTELGDTAKTEIETGAQAVLDARAQFPDSSLADLYDPLTMPAVLQKAHANLDRAVDQAYSYKDTGNEPDRLTFLFAWYHKIIGKEP